MTLKFTKMHGLGNDFMVIDGINQNVHLTPQYIASLAHRNTGVGFDQCLLIEPGSNGGIDFNYRVFNADGQEVGQCGNGARCLALFAKHYGLTTKNQIKIATKTTLMDLQINDNNSVTVNMGTPKMSPSEIPLIAEKYSPQYSLALNNGEEITVHALSVGNPHAVIVVSDLKSTPVHSLGQQISLHPSFPEQTNTGFMQIVNSQHIQLRVYERGSGETLACGSGAVAAAAVGRLYYQLEDKITVSLPGGDLIIDWPQLKSSIFLTGPAAFVYEGTLL